jgi:hypothetical protein
LYDAPHWKALAAGLEWQALFSLSMFTVRTPEPAGKDMPIGVQIFWGKIVHLFEGKIDEREETGLFEFLRPYKRAYPDVHLVRSQAQ